MHIICFRKVWKTFWDSFLRISWSEAFCLSVNGTSVHLNAIQRKSIFAIFTATPTKLMPVCVRYLFVIWKFSHFQTSLYLFIAEFTCLWDLCRFSTANYEIFVRHINYHAYHTKLKTYGHSLTTKITLPQCMNPSKQRNSIPDLPHDFICGWNNCNQAFSPVQDYLDHVQHHLNTDYTHKRDIPCRKMTYLHKTEVKCLWEGCGKICKNVYVLKTHVKQHTKEKYIACFHCGAMFVSKRILVHHNLRQFVTSKLNFIIWKFYVFM